MFEGQCNFSGFMIPKGSGINKVGNDGKNVFTRSRKERTLLDRNIPARRSKWTMSSRAFYKKTSNSVRETEEVAPIIKIVRGFSLIPKAIVSEAPKTSQHKSEKKNEKVNLKSNVSARHSSGKK